MAIVYLLILVIPALIFLVLVGPVVEQTVKLVGNLPGYVHDLEDEIQSNDQLQQLDEDYDITGKLDDLAKELAGKLDDAAAALIDIGAGVVSSLFALVTS